MHARWGAGSGVDVAHISDIEDRPGLLPPNASEEHMRLALEASHLGEWSWNPATDVVDMSPRAAAIFDIPPGPTMTWSQMQDLINPLDRDQARDAVLQSLADRSAYDVEYRIRRPGDGVELWVMARGRVFYDAAGAPAVMLGVVGDISRSKAVEAELRESEARFRAMADSAPAPVWLTSAAGPVDFVNQAFVDYTGKPREALMGDAWYSLLHPDDIPAVALRRHEARATLSPYLFEARFRRADGDWRLMQASCKPRFDGKGAFDGYVGLAVDITEIRAAETALRESEERFRLIAECAPVMLWMGDDQGGCLYLNRALRDFWGVPDDLSGFTWAQTLLPEDAPALFERFGAAMAAQEAFEVEARYRRADGEIRTLTTRAEPRFDAQGAFLGMIGVNVDVTDARRAETHQHLLINELNHRVKNTLATVQSVAHQTFRSQDTVAAVRDALTARLMALSAAHDVLTREVWESAGVREIVAESVRPYESDPGARFAMAGPALRLEPKVALSLAMALHELATNAVKYGALSADTGRVIVVWREAGDRLELEWREEGGPPVSKPARRGFGSRLLEDGLARESGGEAADLRFDPAGLQATLRMPLRGEAEG